MLPDPARVTLPLAEAPLPARRSPPCADARGRLPGDCPQWCPHACPRTPSESAAPLRAARRRARAADRVATRFVVRRLIGQGAMGEVFLADDERSGRPVALKVLHRDVVDQEHALDRFALEGRALERVDHPAIVRLVGRGVHRGLPFIAMEHIAGTTLATVIRAAPVIRLPLARVLGLLRRVAEGLDAVHRAGALHGDLKPQNILLGHQRVVLADFGLAQPFGPSCRTEGGNVFGTPLYLAPELACGLATTPDPVTDVYAFAAVAYELLAGRPPLEGDSATQVMSRQIHDDPPPLSQRRSDLPDRVDDLFAWGLSKRPSERPRSAGAFVDALAAALHLH